MLLRSENNFKGSSFEFEDAERIFQGIHNLQ